MRPNWKSIGILLLILLFGAALLHAASVKSYDRKIREQKRALKKLEKDLKEQKQQIKDLKVQERGVLNSISLLERNIVQTREFIDGLSANVSLMSQSADAYQVQIDSMTVSLQAQKKMMSYRIRKLYMKGDPVYGKLGELIRFQGNLSRYVLYVQSLLESDQQLVDRIVTTQNELESKKKFLQARLWELEQVKAKKSKEQEELNGKVASQKGFLDNLVSSREMQQKALDEYVANQRMLQKLIQRLEKQRKAAAKKKNPKKPAPKVKQLAASSKCWPMRGSIISKYGRQRHAVLKTVTRNLGIEIRGRKTSAVKAAAPGTVAMVTEIQGHGTGVIIDHGDANYTVYGHLENIKIKEGDKVKRCQEFANPGDDDSMNGVKLYFQVSEGVKTVDPLKWLKNAR